MNQIYLNHLLPWFNDITEKTKNKNSIFAHKHHDI